MRTPLVWEGLRGTLGAQLAHLREHLAIVVPPPTKGQSQRFRGTRAGDGLSDEQLGRIVARKGGKWAESARVLADEFRITQWRIESLREREREVLRAVCVS